MYQPDVGPLAALAQFFCMIVPNASHGRAQKDAYRAIVHMQSSRMSESACIAAAHVLVYRAGACEVQHCVLHQHLDAAHVYAVSLPNHDSTTWAF